MALITKTIPGVYGGVSNQSTSLRKDNQVASMINCNPSLVLGTSRRPNAEQGVVDIPDDASFIYDYQRSNQEANILTVSDEGTISASTVGVGSRTVTTSPEVTEYLTHTSKSALSGITLGDTTYLVNSEKVVTTEEVLTDDMPELADLYKSDVSISESSADKIAYYWLSRSSNDEAHPYNYVVELDGVRYEAESDKADVAAALLSKKIKYETVETTLATSVSGNVLTVSAASGDAFEVEVFDGDDDTNLTAVQSVDGLSWDITILSVPSTYSVYTVYLGGSYFSAVAGSPESMALELEKVITGSTELIGSERNHNGYNSSSNGSVVRIWQDSLGDFEFNYWDSWGSLASFGWKGSVSALTDLPSSFPWDGTVVEITSGDGDTSGSYYVIRWGGTWQEYTTRATYSDDGRKLPLLTNMPIVIERLEDGNFEARLLGTEDQLLPPLVGNEDNNKDPNFVGKTIKQLFYLNGRVCIVSGDSLTFSQTDVLWNFYASTVINVLDGDTIEVKIASEKVLTILRVAIFQSGLLIMTSEGQYIFNTEQGISPSTVIVNKLSNYAYSDAGGTVYDGDSIVFSGKTGDTSRLYRYRVARLTSENKAIDLTIQVPIFIQGEVVKIANFVEDGTLIVLTENSKKLYMYREVISGDQMVQSSWYTWDFSNFLTEDIMHIMVIESFVYIVTASGVYKIPLGVHVFEDNYEHLDLGTVAYESRVELTKWRPKKTQAQVQDPRGRLQLRTLGMSIDGKADLEIFKEDRNYTQIKPILNNKNINILSNTDKTVLSVINNGTHPFTINGMAMSGTYREKGKEQI